jgi:AcrR family transcriptional regulator
VKVVAACRDPEGTKRRILEEAEKQFAQVGPFQASVNVIAENAQINKRMIYHYFGSKEELYRTVLKENFQKIYEMEARIFEKQESITANVRQGIRDYYYFLRDNPNYVKIVAWEDVAGGHITGELVRDTLLIGYEKLKSVYHDGVNRGIFRSDISLEQIIISINALCFSTFNRKQVLKVLWRDEIEDKLEKRLEHICDLILARLCV